MRHVLLSLSYLLLHSCQAQKTNPYRTYHCRIGDSPTETLVRIGDKLHHFSEELEGGSGRAVRKQRELNESGLFRALQDKMGSEHDRDVEGEDLVETTTYILTDKGGDSSQNALQSHESEAQFVEYEEGENDQFFKVKACDCKSWLMDQEAYCPADFDHCSVSSEWWGNNLWVNCYHETVITSYARYVWKYVAVIFAMLTLIFCCSRPGHNGIKYFLSFCFPSLNRWIVEEILQNEIAVRNRRQNEVTEIWRRNLREQGYVTGYKLKTKVYRYSAKTTFRESDCDNDDDDDDDRGRDFAHPSPDEEMPPILHDDNNDEPLRQSSNRETSPFVSSSTVETNLCGNQENVSPEDDDQDEDIQTCSICLLSFEDGDRVADLKCNHHFHAECMSEWVKKKNKCPLCQEEGIAEEIRTFDYESVISGHLNLHDANNPNPVSNASLQNSGNGNVSGNHEENDYTMAGLPDNGNNGAGGDANSGDGDTPVERLEGDVPRFASRARRFFRRKIRPIVMGVNSADIVTT